MNQQPFNGFTSETPEFLQLLDADNNKEWFEAHQEEYRQTLLEPFRQLARILAGQFGIIDSGLITDPERVVSCIHGNGCFSRDKSPGKSAMLLTFKRAHTDWPDAPIFFFELSADTYCYGMGFDNASGQTMDWLRKIIINNPYVFRRLIAFLAYQNLFALAENRHKTSRAGRHTQDFVEWHQRKSLYLVCNRKINNNLFSRRIVYELVTGFALLAPIYHLLWHTRMSQVHHFIGDGNYTSPL